MNNNRTPFGVALAFSISTFFASLFLFWILPLLPDSLELLHWEHFPILACLLLSLLVGLLVWLNLKLAALKQQHSNDVWELHRQLETLQQELRAIKQADAATSSNDKD